MFFWDEGNRRWDFFASLPTVPLGKSGNNNGYNYLSNFERFGYNQEDVDFFGAVGGGLSTLFGTSAQYSGFLKGASRFGAIGALVSGGVYANAIVSNQVTTAHHVDIVITGVLLPLATFPLTSGFGIPVAFVYGGIRLVGGGWIDAKINKNFPVLD